MTLILKNAHIDQLIPYVNIHIRHEYFHKQNINYTIYDDIDIFSSPKRMSGMFFDFKRCGNLVP